MTAVVDNPLCPLPDRTVALPGLGFEISPAGRDEADRLLGLPPDRLVAAMIADQESDAMVLVCRRIIHAFLSSDRPEADRPEADRPAADRPEAERPEAERPDPADAEPDLPAVRAELAEQLSRLSAEQTTIRRAVLRERAPLSLIDGCWLDLVSQPATQPAVLVNHLYAQHFALRGAGNSTRSQEQRRRRRLAVDELALPAVGAHDFSAGVRPLTAWHVAWYLALSRLPANFLPEVLGVHYAFRSLAVDDTLLGLAPVLPESAVAAAVAEFRSAADADARRRFRRAVAVTVRLEREHVGLLTELAGWRRGLSLESRVAEVIERHARMAGRQHGPVRVGGRLLSDTFGAEELDLARFLSEFRDSAFVRAGSDGLSPFTRAMKFGGPMFGIFDEDEAAVFRDWVAASQRGERPAIEISPNTVGDSAAGYWAGRVAASAPDDVRISPAPVAPDDRTLFHRLINIENYPNTVALAAEHARRNLAEAEVLFEHGSRGRYTDASWFDYTPEALYARGERVYWDKLVNPYRPLTEIPDRDEVVFIQSTYALGYLIDGAWLHRLGNTGHGDRPSDDLLFGIYADEMGHGDLVKNHLTLTHRVLHSLGIDLPHIRTAEFREQRDLPDELYGFSLHQLALCLHPDTFYNELLGYNYAIEMFGSGELRLHELQKLRHHGFDDCYEQAHLAIDNFSAGHTRQAADIIVAYLDGVRRTAGADVVQQEWRRIWRGYASFALFVEHGLVKQLRSAPVTTAGAEPSELDLLI